MGSHEPLSLPDNARVERLIEVGDVVGMFDTDAQGVVSGVTPARACWSTDICRCVVATVLSTINGAPWARAPHQW
jgi:hypothetical protein